MKLRRLSFSIVLLALIAGLLAPMQSGLIVQATTVNYQVGASSDDCYRVTGGTSHFSRTNQQMEAGAIYADTFTGGGMRFTNIAVPNGATITNAYLTLKCGYVWTGTTVNTRISAEDVDDASTFADSGAAFDSRYAARTTARVDWDSIIIWSLNSNYNSPDIKTVIQEIVDRGGWNSGNDIVIFWEDFDQRSTHQDDTERAAWAYDGSASGAPKLVITYEASSLPTITTNDATYITLTTARLNSHLDDDGGEACDVRFEYDTVSGGGVPGGNETEAQLNYDSINRIYTGLWVWAGQKLDIVNRNVTNLAFPLMKVGSPTGDVNFTIRYDGNNTLINSVTWGNASALDGGTEQWENASFASPVVVNATVHILVEFNGGNATNYILYHHEDSNEKSGENFVHYSGADWSNHSTYDGAYNYSYACNLYSDSTAWVNDTYTTSDSPYADISGLTLNTTYFFRAQARNSQGTVSGTELNFTTTAESADPTNLVAYPSSHSISLTWTKGAGSTNTMVRYRIGTYPTNYTDGSQVYFDDMSTATHSGLSPGISYYYRAWGESGGNYSANYTEAMATTIAGAGAGDEPGAATPPSTWYGSPDHTRLAGVPFYSMINDMANEYGMPPTNFWLLIMLFAATLMGLFVYAISRSAVGSILGGGITLVILLQSLGGLLWIIFAVGIIATGVFIAVRRT